MNSSIYHTLALIKIRRKRIFFGRGELLVKVGQKVSPNDIIANTFPNEKYFILNIRKLLNLNNTSEARRSINLKIGDQLKAGEIIAESQNVFSKPIQTPENSEVISIIGSQVVLRVINNSTPLHAGFDAIVSEILPNQGAILETDGVLIQGVWGNQQIGSGVLINLMESPGDELSKKQLGVELRGSIILGGYCRNSEILKIASDLPLKGMILTGLHPDLLSQAKKLRIPIILIEGFSPCPMNIRAFNLIKSNVGRELTINSVYNLNQNEKPEIVIPVQADALLPSEFIDFNPGLVVRVNNGNHMGRAGNFNRILKGTITLSNGVRTTCALVNFSDKEQLQIPLANLDILE